MTTGPADTPGGRRRRRAIAAALVVTVVLAVVAGVVLWRARHARARPLEPGWEAVVVAIAGDGVAGVRDGEASRARFSDPFGVAAAPDGTIYVSDAGDAQRIRRISPQGIVSTVAGGVRGYANGGAADARFDTPSGLAVDAAGTVYVADTGNNVIRRIAADGTVSTLAGDGTAGYRDGDAALARFNGPIGIAVDQTGRVLVADTYNDRIRAIHPDGTVSTLAGIGAPGPDDGEAAAARFDTPCGVAIDRTGNVFVADTGNGAIRVISPSGLVSTVGPVPEGALFRPIGIAAAGGGVVYVTDERGRVAEIVTGVSARVVAGSRPGFADGSGIDARFRALAGLALASEGRLIAADPRNALVRLVSARARLELRAPVPPQVAPAFDAGAFRIAPLLWPVAPMDGPFEITGTLGELRGGDGTERFHSGLDIRAPEGTLVRAIRPGVVAAPIAAAEFGTLNESVRIGSLTYVHLRVGREHGDAPIDPGRFVATYDELGRMAYLRAKRGARFDTGEPIGTANPFNHVHLNVGWPGEEENPLAFRLVHFEDTKPPAIPRGGIKLFREDGQPLTIRRRGRVLVDGRIRIVVDAWDQVDGNEARRRLGLYSLGYQVLNRDGSAAPGFGAPRETIRFDRLAGSADARTIYASGSGIPFFGRRSTHFFYVVTSTLRDGVTADGVWDASLLEPGDYILRILAADINGNEARTNRDLAVTVVRQP